MTVKPTLGYPTRTAAVKALRKQGLSLREIAATLNISRSCAGVLANVKRWRSLHEHGNRAVVIPVTVLDALEPEAEKRGLSVNELVRLILETVVADKIVPAVLADEGAYA